jgi:radical SAM protein with 4Fe4S-binding SPASM domain
MPDGSVFPCNLFAGFEEFRLGNIFLDRIEKIWNNPILKPFRTPHKNACGRDDCSHSANCGGGCPAHSYFFYGTINARTQDAKSSSFSTPLSRRAKKVYFIEKLAAEDRSSMKAVNKT